MSIKINIDLEGKNDTYLDSIIQKYHLELRPQNQAIILSLKNSSRSKNRNDVLWAAYRLSGEYDLLLDMCTDDLKKLQEQSLPIYGNSGQYKAAKPAYQH